ncbi:MULTISPECIES: helix-turn-helix domain-containing protein [Olivibacter]|jgi:transcriptional regulator with XRE-family HTH domain|uniref:Helix-turn-helix domain-containing protein n=1 Tax=Olivibacter oleidegradans TaxID=760123 RepID=A0ABV6HGV3_9SPHI|nr:MULTISPECIES: helix-turn-helix transcriptional regulator [Olivibacter]MDM8176743.1 helix-turn-helix transcriptional regulator [Olivibacter sp. 47]QEL00561.1 helix-turn-helix transcriptional regulator [Olivibacter sp. LS-1]
MDKHYGHIIERIIRRNGYSISELARLTNVNRRSIYNWFNQKNLKPEIIFRIGCALKHDFSEEFPELFTEDEFQKVIAPAKTSEEDSQTGPEISSSYWKDKYIRILEEYNRLLVNQVKQEPKKS